MIKYTTSQMSGSTLTADETTGFMIDLWHEYGIISCRTILVLPGHEADMQLWLYDSVAAIPDLKLCFRTPDKITYKGVLDVINVETAIKSPMSAALSATIMVMDSIARRECEHYDMNVNLAECCGDTIDFDWFKEDDDPLPF